ncbi:MAG TPA: CDP-alcohol phosphatidyltransferase family protein [Gemmatimonadaceae bacterium]
MKSGALLTLPNTVSLSRLVLAAAFIVADGAWQRVLLIAAAGATDFLDGWIARRQRIESRTGALIDPVADRAFVLTAMSVYLFESLISTTEYFVILARDFATALGFLVAKAVPKLRPAVFEARLLGKTVTVLQLSFLVIVLLLPVLSDALVLAIGVLSAASIVDYTIALWRARAR